MRAHTDRHTHSLSLSLWFHSSLWCRPQARFQDSYLPGSSSLTSLPASPFVDSLSATDDARRHLLLGPLLPPTRSACLAPTAAAAAAGFAACPLRTARLFLTALARVRSATRARPTRTSRLAAVPVPPLMTTVETRPLSSFSRERLASLPLCRSDPQANPSQALCEYSRKVAALAGGRLLRR